jgi:hypothetical protein
MTDPIQPQKHDIRDWGTWVESIVNAFISNGGLVYIGRAQLYADLAHAFPASAWVVMDPVAANNGIYQKQGVSGSGSWFRVADLPYSFIVASDVGAGTPNAILATTSIPVSASSLVVMNVADANTGSPVTVSFNGGAVLTVKSNSGLDIQPGSLAAGGLIMGFVSGSYFQLANDEAVASLVFAARDATIVARDAAIAARDIAAGYASTAISVTGNVIYATVTGMSALTIPAGISAFRCNGYSAAGDGGGGFYMKVASAPSHSGKVQTVGGIWWELIEESPVIEQFGGVLGSSDSLYAAAAAKVGTYMTQKGRFWSNPYTLQKGVPQVRFPGRVFVGGAAANDGAFWSAGGTGRPGGLTNRDWLGLLATDVSLGNAGKYAIGGSDVSYSQFASLTDKDSDVAAMAVPIAGGTFATEASNSLTNSTPRGVQAYAVNNPKVSAGQSPSIWAQYTEAHRVTPNAGNTYGLESEVRDISGNAATNWTPYTTPGAGIVGVAYGSGAGLDPTQAGGPTTAVGYVTANPTQFAAGLIVFDGAIGPYGSGGTKPALMLPYDNCIQWFKTGGALAVNLVSDTFGNLHVKLNSSARMVVDGNVETADGGGLVFGNGSGSSSTYVAGSGTGGFITMATNGVERARVMANGAVRLAGLGSDPSGGSDGQFYYNSTTKKLRFHNGTAWGDV